MTEEETRPFVYVPPFGWWVYTGQCRPTAIERDGAIFTGVTFEVVGAVQKRLIRPQELWARWKTRFNPQDET